MRHKRFIMDESDKFFKDWLIRKKAIDKEVKLEREFLHKRIASLHKREGEIWEELFTHLKDEKVIPKTMDYEKVEMELTESKPTQLFLGERVENPFASMLEGILNK